MSLADLYVEETIKNKFKCCSQQLTQLPDDNSAELAMASHTKSQGSKDNTKHRERTPESQVDKWGRRKSSLPQPNSFYAFNKVGRVVQV
ncbi:unnamed protein product [Allacma fusca]|uniref:Uncharacterized protein n=1 Tax=Allacma fusca TaxID=39272 RepID=A0A8J2NZQ9_9HEXA|nr:unnamed protein product [Allacma fusca]